MIVNLQIVIGRPPRFWAYAYLWVAGLVLLTAIPTESGIKARRESA